MPTQVGATARGELIPAMRPELAVELAARFGPNLSLVEGTAVGKKTADGLLYAYVDANADGTQTAVGVTRFKITTDANGKVYLTDSAVATPGNIPKNDAPIYVIGIFDPADLTGLDAAGKVDLGVRTLPNGLLKF